jgi:hypothetical protein
MKPMLQVIRNAVREEVVNTGKYVQQLQYLLQQNDSSALSERLEKGSAYYSRILGEQIAALLLHMQQMQWRTGVKAYLNTLAEVDHLLMKKYEDIAKSVIIIQGLLNREQFIDVRSVDAQRGTLRQRWLDEAREKGRAKSEGRGAKGSKKVRGEKKKTSEKSDKPSGKGETVRITLELFKSGKTLEQIGAERTLAQSTIEGHIVKAIANGQLALSTYVNTDDAAIIEAAITEHGASGLKPVQESLGDRYTWGMIKAVAAASEV